MVAPLGSNNLNYSTTFKQIMCLLIIWVLTIMALNLQLFVDKVIISFFVSA
jgi:hypothetical protein